MALSENVIEVLKTSMWYVATFNDDPNVVPIGFKQVTEDGKLVIGDVFLQRTLANIEANGKIAIVAAKGMECYQVKGTAVYTTDDAIVAPFKAMADAMFKGTKTAKGAIVVTPETVIINSPNKDNNKEI